MDLASFEDGKLGFFEFGGNTPEEDESMQVDDLSKNEKKQTVFDSDGVEKPSDRLENYNTWEHQNNAFYTEMTSIPNIVTAHDKEIDECVTKFWGKKDGFVFRDEIVVKIWNKFLIDNDGRINVRKLFCLDLCNYLKDCLWPNYTWESKNNSNCSSVIHVLSIVLIMNERFRLFDKNHFEELTGDKLKFAGFITHLFSISIGSYDENSFSAILKDTEKCAYTVSIYKNVVLTFIINLFYRLESPIVQNEVLRLCNLPVWSNLDVKYRQKLFENCEFFKEKWEEFEKTTAAIESSYKEPPEEKEQRKNGRVNKSTRISNSRSRNKKNIHPPNEEPIYMYKSSKIPSIQNIKLLRNYLQKNFIYDYVHVFLNILNSANGDRYATSYCERFVEFLTDILSQKKTRSYLVVLFKNMQLFAKLKLSKLYLNNSNLAIEICKEYKCTTCFVEKCNYLIDIAYHYIDDLNNKSTDASDLKDSFCFKFRKFMCFVYTEFRDKLKDFINTSSLTFSDRNLLKQQLNILNEEELKVVCEYIGLNTNVDGINKNIMLESILLDLTFRDPRSDYKNKIETLPDENILYKTSPLHYQKIHYNTESLPLPKLNMQFLTMEDYLLRITKLYLIESNSTVAQDISAVVNHILPQKVMDPRNDKEITVFTNNLPFTAPIEFLKITNIEAKGPLDDDAYSVSIELKINLSRMPLSYKQAWKNLRNDEVLFLLSIDNVNKIGTIYKNKNNLLQKTMPNEVNKACVDTSLKHVRGCRFTSYVVEVSNDKEAPNHSNFKRFHKKYLNSEAYNKYLETISSNNDTITLCLHLDPVSYRKDVMDKLVPTENDVLNNTEIVENNVYMKMNVLFRRKPQENNFESILPSLSNKLNEKSYNGADWLHDIILGNAKPAAINSILNSNSYKTIDFGHIFEDLKHIRSHFTDKKVTSINLTLGSEENKVNLELDIKKVKSVPKNRNSRSCKKKADTTQKTGKGSTLDVCTSQTSTVESQCLPPYIITFPLPCLAGVSKIETSNFSYRAKEILCNTIPRYNKSMFEEINVILNSEKRSPDEVNDYLNPHEDSILVHSYREKSLAPLSQMISHSHSTKPPSLKYTTKQLEAITSGLTNALTLIVGPPGTGKTDVAVRIVECLHRNYPDERILVITHSNQALNQVFEKLYNIGIDPQYLLRLGHGEEELQLNYNYINSQQESSDSSSGWGKFGRINAFLETRLKLLEKVALLADSLDIPGSHGETCKRAEFFKTRYIVPLWENFIDKIKTLASQKLKINKNDQPTSEMVKELFPFSKYLKSIANNIFKTVDEKELWQLIFPDSLSFIDSLIVAQEYYEHLNYIFEQLNKLSIFENILDNNERANYLLTEQAKIVAMTCTHAAMRHKDFVNYNFSINSIVMEEASQVLESDMIVPLYMQSNVNANNRGENVLKRIVMIGDHKQLPPVVRNRSLQKYSHMDQSMFLRFIRLQYPVIQLDFQGRCRTSICDLFRSIYADLKDIDSIRDNILMKRANPGFAFEYQIVDVPLHNGNGEFQPRQYFVQNYQEANYIVSVYAYMILLGYPSSKISILVAYNGQQELISQILRLRKNEYKKYNFNLPFPRYVSTVDKFQGQQSDYVLLSLTRTNAIGHLRDIRRLVVSISRARLGLYIFCHTQILSKCLEIREIWLKLCTNPHDALYVYCGEKYSDLIDTPSSFRNEYNASEIKKPSKNALSSDNSHRKINPKYKDNVFRINGFEHMAAYVMQMLDERQSYLIEKQNKEKEAHSGTSAPPT